MALSIRIPLTWSGVSSGRCWSSKATAPDTTAAAWDVPLPRSRSSPTRPASLRASEYEPGLRRLTMDRPGATMSMPRAALPRLENPARRTCSSLTASAAPTAMT